MVEGAPAKASQHGAKIQSVGFVPQSPFPSSCPHAPSKSNERVSLSWVVAYISSSSHRKTCCRGDGSGLERTSSTARAGAAAELVTLRVVYRDVARLPALALRYLVYSAHCDNVFFIFPPINTLTLQIGSDAQDLTHFQGHRISLVLPRRGRTALSVESLYNGEGIEMAEWLGALNEERDRIWASIRHCHIAQPLPDACAQTIRTRVSLWGPLNNRIPRSGWMAIALLYSLLRQVFSDLLTTSTARTSLPFIPFHLSDCGSDLQILVRHRVCLRPDMHLLLGGQVSSHASLLEE